MSILKNIGRAILAFFGITTAGDAKQRIFDAGKAALEAGVRAWFGGLSSVEKANLTAQAVEDSLHAVIAVVPITTLAKAQAEVAITKAVSEFNVPRHVPLGTRGVNGLENEIVAALKGAKIK